MNKKIPPHKSFDNCIEGYSAHAILRAACGVAYREHLRSSMLLRKYLIQCICIRCARALDYVYLKKEATYANLSRIEILINEWLRGTFVPAHVSLTKVLSWVHLSSS